MEVQQVVMRQGTQTGADKGFDRHGPEHNFCARGDKEIERAAAGALLVGEAALGADEEVDPVMVLSTDADRYVVNRQFRISTLVARCTYSSHELASFLASVGLGTLLLSETQGFFVGFLTGVRHDGAVSPRIAAQRTEPLLFAHRGASAEAPDNTIESFTRALELGTNALESDVWASGDGIAVLAHDDNVGGLVRRQLITKSAAADLPDHVPTMADVLAAVGPDITMSLDIKHPEAIDPTVEALRSLSEEYGEDLVQRTWLCHPNFELVSKWRSRWSDVRLVHSTRLERVEGGPERHAAQLFEAGIDAVNFRAPDWSGGLTTLYHRFDIYCFGWDAHLQRVSEELLDMGCDAIFSNYVDRMLAARAKVYGF